MATTIFSASVIKSINKPLNQEITNAVIGSKGLKTLVNRVLQQANRRIQNIENAGLASPAVKAVYSERGKKYYICEHNPETCDFIAWNGPDKNGVIVAATIEEKTTKKKTKSKKTTKKNTTSKTKTVRKETKKSKKIRSSLIFNI